MNTLRMKHGKILSLAVRILLCAGVILWTLQALFAHGLSPVLSYKDYAYQAGTNEVYNVMEGVKTITQDFLARGNRLNHLKLYFNQKTDARLNISLLSPDGQTVVEQEVDCLSYSPENWHIIFGFSAEKLKKDAVYTLRVSSESGLSMLSICEGPTDDLFFAGTQNGQPQDMKLAMGVNCTYTYITEGAAAEFALTSLFSLLLAAGLCYGIFRFREILEVFRHTENKGPNILPAIYFAVSTVLIFNPLAAIRNEARSFKRILGEGLMENVDVSRRTSNFFLWFLVFAIVFTVFFLLVNYIRQKKDHPEAKKMIHFLEQFMVVAFCTLIIRCITYFQDEAADSFAFHFTNSAVMLIAMISVVYVCAGLYRKISVSDYTRIHFLLAVISIPVAVLLPTEWNQGKLVLGVWGLLALAATLWMALGGKRGIGSRTSGILAWCAVMLSFLPFLTSGYIEMMHILNQHQIFVAHPARYYLIAMAVYAVLSVAVSIPAAGKKGAPQSWEKIAYPALVIGVACLSVQIPMSTTYYPDLFEGANAGVLISDYLHFGVIPNVGHFSGHMMTDVWEGLLYALLNNDYAGAYVSPYAGMLAPLLIVLFYWFVREVWDEDAALFTALFLSFYDYWSYFGLGMLLCLAVVAYVKKNTWPRAIAMGGAFVWCALYRLDLGFAFFVAAVAALITWMIHTKKAKPAKQLLLSLAGWGVFMVLLWCGLCLIQHVDPVKRLYEFLMICFSNENYAFAGIGDEGRTLFAWTYLIIPLTMTGCLLHATLSKSFRENMGESRWILLLMLGWAYFGNFSRGIVRHSLTEDVSIYVTWTTTWTAYLFLALYLACVRKNIRSFVPAFMALMLINTLFIQGENFSGASVAENAATVPDFIIESWTPDRFAAEQPDQGETYWERVGRSGTVVQRVRLDPETAGYAEKYQEVMDALLEPGETFADFMNKTLLYCILGREDPTYISQSPLQLSGEFTQQQYIEEISDVPLVILPIEDFRASIDLDGLTNAYRYYLVSEYIYSHFQPLCRYEDTYAVWVRKERAEEFIEKFRSAFPEKEYISELSELSWVEFIDLSLAQDGEGAALLTTAGESPALSELQECVDLEEYDGKDMRLLVSYTTDAPGTMKVYYTARNDDEYDEEHVATAEIDGEGEAEFLIPVTEDSRICLKLPEGSNMTIRSLRTAAAVSRIDYGYDDSSELLHMHTLGHLPGEWAEKDKQHALENRVQSGCNREEGYYRFDAQALDRTKGNYLDLQVSFDGDDWYGYSENDDEEAIATAVLGHYEDGSFKGYYRYDLTVTEGRHDYLIRCSTDYYWYTGEINAVRLSCTGSLYNIGMKILEGD